MYRRYINCYGYLSSNCAKQMKEFGEYERIDNELLLLLFTAIGFSPGGSSFTRWQ
jgi:hypothetical protein